MKMVDWTTDNAKRNKREKAQKQRKNIVSKICCFFPDTALQPKNILRKKRLILKSGKTTDIQQRLRRAANTCQY